MIMDKSKVVKLLEKELEIYTRVNNSDKQKIIDKLVKKRNFKVSYAADLITLRKDLNDETIFVLFCLVDILIPKQLTKMFTDKEIDMFSNEKYNQTRIKFPLELPVQRISDGQYSYVADLDFAMQLRDDQLIIYNVKHQRPMSLIVKGNVEYYTITVDRNQVEGIEESIRTGKYIPQHINLNLPETAQYEFKSDKKGDKLIIYECEGFDIIDGFHRWIAMSNVYNINPEIDYTIPLMITTFSDAKVNDLIYQHDQKVKMSRIEAESYNSNNAGNRVVNLLNGDMMLSGLINNNDGIINEALLSATIKCVYFKDRQKYVQSDYIRIKKELINAINQLLDSHEELLDSKWSNEYIVSFIMCASLNKVDKFDEIVQLLIDNPVVKYNDMKPTYINRIIKLIDKEGV